MKFVKRISLFFIYPLIMYAIGFASNMLIMEFFYPGNTFAASEIQRRPLEAAEEDSSLEASVQERPIVTANTQYIIQSYDINTEQIEEKEEVTPDKYIGLTREQLVEALEEYNQSPPLMELEKGFVYAELVTFSPARIAIRKAYEQKQEEGFFLLNEDHYVVVYDYSLEHLYMNTGIVVEDLPQDLQSEIIQMKFVENETELYNFLESFSS